MAKVIFNEGAVILADSGWPTTVSVALSTKACSGGGSHVAADTISSFGEITGGGYARIDLTEPSPSTGAGAKDWAIATFSTGASPSPAWSNAVKSAVFIDKVANKLLAAVDLAATRDMSQPNTTLTIDLATSISAV